MNAKVIGMAVAAGTAVVATGIVAKIVRSKKAKARDTLLHDIKEYVDTMDDWVNNIGNETTTMLASALKMERLTLEIGRRTNTATAGYIDDSYVHEVLVQLRIMINRVYILYKEIIDNTYLSDEQMSNIIKNDCDRVMEQIDAVKNAL